MLKALPAAEKVAKYRHAAFSAVRLGIDINANLLTEGSVEELIAKLKNELRNLG